MTRRQLALSLLRDAGPRGVTTAEFLQSGVGSRYSARVRELRQAGHSITSERVREGSWRYTLEVEERCPICHSADPAVRKTVHSGPESWLCMDRFHGSLLDEAVATLKLFESTA